MKELFVPVDSKKSFLHTAATMLGIHVPDGLSLPIDEGMSPYHPWCTLSLNLVNENHPSSLFGVYVLAVWIPRLKQLATVYVGSGRLARRLALYANIIEKGIKVRDDAMPKYRYNLLRSIPQGYWLVSWSECIMPKIHENNLYHALKHQPYIINARAPIRDRRTYRRFQMYTAQMRARELASEFKLVGIGLMSKLTDAKSGDIQKSLTDLQRTWPNIGVDIE